MYQPYVLIHQPRPSHQILLHQALNAQGLFNVRISANANDLDACLNAERRPDLLILDHAMPTRSGLALLARQHRSRALLFVGKATPKHQNLAQEARNQGLWVLAELPWPLSMPRLQRALQTLQARPRQRIQTVISSPHAH
ncbi:MULTISPECIES: response regulator [Pseudomonas]|jgi:DNA-binding NtrC family response regulator|uniref:Histidine kinase n=2 Tax=Pseudomonas putida group TaxID=136845 RepID=A0AAE6RA28_9PSED|nr:MULTISPECIES: response regulator [Pseudomonas]MCJ7851197.1 response regulator [Pseudomonas monteilii]MDD2122862.1 response regulator [Pseudomonas monteilii]MDI3368053.1 response regulator [Pseudomonas sp. V104_10]QHB26370.1 histidine kinase [Pseudomonas monteilii]SMC98374.1 Response regulator containing CheY-like receiver, AAA-type ATPase, and DNA-binding domains [Pseudomonas sp. URIL14HWK12:I5]